MYIDTKTKISKALLYALLLGYPITAMASVAVFEQTTGLNVFQAVYAFIMGFWGAVASLSRKFATDAVSKSWGRVIFADVINATLASTITYMFCAHLHVPPALMGVLCALSGFGGISFMDWAYKKFMDKADRTV